MLDDTELAPTAARWGAIGAISGALGVVAGAFGAHALRDRIDPRMLEVFETAARYQMLHALALVAVAWLVDRGTGRAATVAGWCFALGTVLFSGSLFALALTGVRMYGAITPIGGLLFILGWASLAAAFMGRR